MNASIRTNGPAAPRHSRVRDVPVFTHRSNPELIARMIQIKREKEKESVRS